MDPGRWHQEPLLLVANHTNWWDGFLAHQVTRALGLHFQILMDAKGVAAYPVFKRFGAVPVRRGSAAGSVADLQSVGLNLRPGVAVWIFPQGERRPQGARVAGCEHGAAHLALACERVRIVPVAIRYPFLSEQLPEGFLFLGGSWMAGRAQGPAGGRESRQALSALTMGGSNTGDFLRSGTCAVNTALGASQSCTVVFTFAPTASGTRTATLTVSTANGSPVLNLSGTGKLRGK